MNHLLTHHVPTALATNIPRLGILNDYVRIPYANGSSFASQFLYREFRRRGSEVTVIGAHDPQAQAHELPPQHICFSSLPLRNHPGVNIPMPDRLSMRKLADANLSMVVGQTGSALLDAGLWLRRTQGVPLVCVNTIHLPSVYDVLLPSILHRSKTAHSLLQNRIIPWVERKTAEIYNGSDGLVVLSSGLKDYWEERGVRVPITVIPRSVDPSIFDQRPDTDPFPAWSESGSRLLVVCRHTREKNVLQLLSIFAQHILPSRPGACLALVGDGPDHDLFKEHARALGIYDRCVFPGEVSLPDIPAWYRAADVFVYTSLSETYGQVVSEALWCGLPVVALRDGKGVADQVLHGHDGFLFDPAAADCDASFGRSVVKLLEDVNLRATLSAHAERRARHRADPQRCIAAYEKAFEVGRQHCLATWRAPSASERRAPVLRWFAMHSLLYVLGWMRSPAIVNRHGRKQPVWDLPERRAETSEARVLAGMNSSPALRLVG
jgi:1,2-diacylglycerol 3-alpha-glucosyltransferase